MVYMFRCFKQVAIYSAYFLLFIVIIRTFFLDIFRIPSNSMEDQLNIGDIIVVNKFSYSNITASFGYSQNPGFNEIFVFKNDIKDPTIYVKRCIGLPGQTIKIIDGEVYINGLPISEKKTVKHYYQIWAKNARLVEAEISKAKNIEISRKYPKYIFASLNMELVSKIKEQGEIDSIKIAINVEKPIREQLTMMGINEEIQQMPSLKLPHKGMTIRLDENTPEEYFNIIKKFEEKSLEKDGNSYFLNRQLVKKYVFDDDYYFMMGDNRDNSVDSRYYGLIPRKLFIGHYIFKI